jgi:hypothetical protein
MENYKGIYYNESKEKKYFEGGAHFKYDILFKALLSLGGKLQEEESYDNPSFLHNDNKEQNQINKDVNYLFRKIEKKAPKYKTRNLAEFKYLNNPNTKILLNTRNIRKNGKLLVRNGSNTRSRNVKNNYYFEKNNSSYVNKTTVSNNSIKKKLNNRLINYFLYKKKISKKSEERNDENVNKINIINNNNNTNEQSISNCLKYIHNRNRSDAILNINNNTLNNNISSKEIENDNNFYIKKNQNLININKSSYMIKNNKNNISNIRNNIYNYYNKIEINKLKYENNRKDANENNKNCKEENSSININIPLVYNKSKISILKDKLKLKGDLSYDKNEFKRLRNITSKNIISYNTYEANKIINTNYRKKYINNCIPSIIENKSKKENDINNGSYSLNNISNTLNKTANIKKYIYTYGSNVSGTINIKSKQKNFNLNGNNFTIQKYVKKKINQLYVLNQNNEKIGNLNLSNKINKNF